MSYKLDCSDLNNHNMLKERTDNCWSYSYNILYYYMQDIVPGYQQSQYGFSKLNNFDAVVFVVIVLAYNEIH